MANRRVSELNELLSTQLAANDLILIADVSAIESKRIRASELKAFSLNGTASYSFNSLSSSYSLRTTSASWSPPMESASYALSTSYSDWARSASVVISASWALSSSFASRSFWATTSSYSLKSETQLVISSGLADLARSASHLIYTNGLNNGTASAAIVAFNATSSLSSSLLIYNGGFNGSASYALTSSQCRTSSFSSTSSFLNYTASKSNGTASFAVSASNAVFAKYVRAPMYWGLYESAFSSISESKITSMSIVTTESDRALTVVTVNGTVIFPFTASNTSDFPSGSITLGMKSETIVAEYVLDSTYIGTGLFGTGTTISGTLIQPFSLSGCANALNGVWTFWVSASNCILDERRPIYFRVESQATSVQKLF